MEYLLFINQKGNELELWLAPDLSGLQSIQDSPKSLYDRSCPTCGATPGLSFPLAAEVYLAQQKDASWVGVAYTTRLEPFIAWTSLQCYSYVQLLPQLPVDNPTFKWHHNIYLCLRRWLIGVWGVTIINDNDNLQQNTWLCDWLCLWVIFNLVLWYMFQYKITNIQIHH